MQALTFLLFISTAVLHWQPAQAEAPQAACGDEGCPQGEQALTSSLLQRKQIRVPVSLQEEEDEDDVELPTAAGKLVQKPVALFQKKQSKRKSRSGHAASKKHAVAQRKAHISKRQLHSRHSQAHRDHATSKQHAAVQQKAHTSKRQLHSRHSQAHRGHATSKQHAAVQQKAHTSKRHARRPSHSLLQKTQVKKRSASHTLRRGHAASKKQIVAKASQALRDQSDALDQAIQSVAATLSPGDNTFEFLRALRMCASCGKYERVGEDNDGGYVMCADGLEHGLLGAYSFGVNGVDGWGMAVASRFNIPLHEYDCFNLKRPAVCHGCNVTFNEECIAGPNDAPKPHFKTLGQQLKDAGNSDAQDGSLLLKIDVEGSEWSVFADEPLESLRKFRQINVEYHNLEMQQNHGRYLQSVKKVAEAGFAVTHLHGNNYGNFQHFGQYGIPTVLEVTYIRPAHAGYAAEIPYRLPLHDQPNNAGSAELPDATLPQ